jgi:hypothetical protein
MEVNVRRDIKWNKNDVPRSEHKLMILEGEMTLLQAYMLPPTTQAITTHSSHTVSCNEAAIR